MDFQQKGLPMKNTVFAVAALFALSGLAACESKADKAAEVKADSLEAQAAATPNEAEEKALNEKADRIEQQAGNADGGATTANTPTTEPAK
jgi:maltose-binding protein MalE